MHVVLIETSGNQHYIFASNKLRENVGASELTYRVGTETVLKAVAEVTDNQIKLLDDEDLNGAQLRANLLDKNRNPELRAGRGVEVITATSGKALLIVENEDIGKRIVKKVTETALLEMPGLTVHGAISKNFGDLAANDFGGIHKAIGEVHRKHEQVRHQTHTTQQRFLRVPFFAPCATSGLPANEYYSKGPEPNPRSAVTISKREASRLGEQRLEAVIHSVAKDVRTVSTEELEREFGRDAEFGEGLGWVAVVHADGNGVGEIFLNFDEYSGLKNNECTPRDYITQYRRFSLALDVCTINAAAHALENLRKRWLAEVKEKPQARKPGSQQSQTRIPVVPLILGGDDLTILCDGQYALRFVHEFLTEFEKETEEVSNEPYLNVKVADETILDLLRTSIPRIANKAFSAGRLGICAGIAIVKPHYPFHQAYELAEKLLKSAKEVKTKITQSNGKQFPSSAMDFHVLYDSAHSDLEEIRNVRLKTQYGAYLSAKPYVVTVLDGWEKNSWLRYRKFDELKKRVEAMREPAAEDTSRRALPNSKMHDIRESLFRGKDIANAEAGLVKKRLDEQGQKVFKELLVTENSLFFDESTKEGSQRVSTHFLDAIEAVDFWKGFLNGQKTTESEASQ